MPRVKQQNTLSSVLDPRVAAVDAVAGLLPAGDPPPSATAGLDLAELGRRTLSLVERLQAAPYAARLAELPKSLWPAGRLVELKRLGQAAIALEEGDPASSADATARDKVVREATELRDRLIETVESSFPMRHPIHAELKGVGRPYPGWVANDLERLRTCLEDRQPQWTGTAGAVEASALGRVDELVDTLRAGPSADWSWTRRKLRAVLIQRFTEARLFGRAVVADGTEAPALPTMGSRRKKKPASAGGAEAKETAEKKAKVRKAKVQKAEASADPASPASSPAPAGSADGAIAAPSSPAPSSASAPPPVAVGDDG